MLCNRSGLSGRGRFLLAGSLLLIVLAICLGVYFGRYHSPRAANASLRQDDDSAEKFTENENALPESDDAGKTESSSVVGVVDCSEREDFQRERGVAESAGSQTDEDPKMLSFGSHSSQLNSIDVSVLPRTDGFYQVISLNDAGDSVAEPIPELQSAVAEWHKLGYSHSKVLYDNNSVLLNFSRWPRIGDLLTKAYNDKTLELQRKPFFVTASVSDQIGIQIEGVSRKLQSIERIYNEIGECGKVIYEWKPIYKMYEGSVIQQNGSELECDQIIDVIQSFDADKLSGELDLGFILIWHDAGSDFWIRCKTEQLAVSIWNTIPENYPAALCSYSTGVIRRRGEHNDLLDQTIVIARTLNTVFPLGSWSESCQRAQSWFDFKSDRHIVQVCLTEPSKESSYGTFRVNCSHSYCNRNGRLLRTEASQ